MKDLTMLTVGELTVIEFVGRNRHGHAMWKCQCSCGKTPSIVGFCLTGHRPTLSCGHIKVLPSKYQPAIHGESGTRLYRTWSAMKNRCLNPRSTYYCHYGGRGIAVCERWMKYENFRDDMGERPSSKLSLDRIDNDGNYEPGNCRWATKGQQSNNTRSNLRVEVDGVIRTLTDLLGNAPVKRGTAERRIRRGWSITKAVNTPTMPRGGVRGSVRGSAKKP